MDKIIIMEALLQEIRETGQTFCANVDFSLRTGNTVAMKAARNIADDLHILLDEFLDETIEDGGDENEPDIPEEECEYCRWTKIIQR